jgi:dUTP pyrophosphatase
MKTNKYLRLTGGTFMNLRMAKMNWKNFFNQMIGNPKTYDVKVERTDEAKKYPLLSIKKDGDVGYDLPSLKTMVVKAPTPTQRAKYQSYMDSANKIRAGIGDNADLYPKYVEEAERLEKLALEQLPKTVIPTGIKIEMPNNIWCTISARSSTSNKMLITPDSIIDAGYRGELFAVVFNIGYSDVYINAGDRICQVIFHERILANMKEVDKLSPSERGESGFGSTGR